MNPTKPRALLLGGNTAAKSLSLDSPELVELLLEQRYEKFRKFGEFRERGRKA